MKGDSNNLEIIIPEDTGTICLRDCNADLLDGFAKAALTGIMVNRRSEWTIDDYAAHAYNVAQSMMSERARRREVGR